MNRRANSHGQAEPDGSLPIQLDPAQSSDVSPVNGRGTYAAERMTRDVILEACRRSNWVPDSTSMLQFSAGEPWKGAEEFRALRSRLYQIQAATGLKCLLIISAVPGEGRSFVAASLAQVMALQPECRVLLIDADLREPRLHRSLGTSSVPGLSDYLLQETEEFGIMQRGSAENLFFIPAGRRVNGPTELVANGRMKSLIDRVQPLFDWIVIDSPAAIPVSDAGLLANYCDGVLMVVRSNSTPFDLVRRAQRRFREESVVGVVLNEIEGGSNPDLRQWRNSIHKSGF